MAGHRSFEEQRLGMSPARRARNREATAGMLHEMALHELRQARHKSQQELARDLHVGQPAVARLERRADMYISNLRRYIEALGGTLEITACFPDASVTITNFEELAGTKERRPLKPRTLDDLTTLDEFLTEDHKREVFEAIAAKEVLNWQVEKAMKERKLRRNALRQRAGRH